MRRIADGPGVAPSLLEDVLEERSPVTPDLAVRLSAMFGAYAETRLRVPSAVDLWDAERAADTSTVPPVGGRAA